MKSDLLAICVLFVFTCALGAASRQEATDIIPHFVAEGVVSGQAYGSSSADRKTEGTFTFYQSNRWWQVEIKYPTAQKDTPSVHNCMKVPDGVRYYTLFTGDTRTSMTVAEVCPQTYPPPGSRLMFSSWLTLSPAPQLPLIDAHRIRRFLNVPDCRVTLLNHNKNQGNYRAKYLQPQGVFLSELIITNNGIGLGIGIDNGDLVRPFPPPFDEGFVEFHYQVLTTTNIGGITFPLRSELRRYSPKINGTSTTDVELKHLAQLTLERVNSLESIVAKRIPSPAALAAFDSRPPNIPREHPIRYVVTNDHWKPASDPELVHLAQMIIHSNNPEKKIPRWFFVTILALAVISPILILFRKPKRKLHTNKS